MASNRLTILQVCMLQTECHLCIVGPHTRWAAEPVLASYHAESPTAACKNRLDIPGTIYRTVQVRLGFHLTMLLLMTDHMSLNKSTDNTHHIAQSENCCSDCRICRVQPIQSLHMKGPPVKIQSWSSLQPSTPRVPMPSHVLHRTRPPPRHFEHLRGSCNRPQKIRS